MVLAWVFAPPARQRPAPNPVQRRHPHPPREQTAGHLAARARRSGGGCALIPLLLAAGCGALSFVPSPYTPQHVELIYSAQEDITVVRWRVGAAAPRSEERRVGKECRSRVWG